MQKQLSKKLGLVKNICQYETITLFYDIRPAQTYDAQVFYVIQKKNV